MGKCTSSLALSFALAVATMVPSSRGEEAAAAKNAEIVTTITKLMAELSQSAETLDAAKTLAPLTTDKEALFIFDSKLYTREKLVETLAAMYAQMKSMKIKMDPPKVRVLGPDAALWVATGTADSVDKAGAVFHERLIETWVWQRLDGKWQVVHYHEGVDSRPPAPPAK